MRSISPGIPTDLPPPIHRTTPQKVVVNLETVEVTGQLADGTTYRYWTFGGKVPGPMIRVRQGDTVEIHLNNRQGNSMAHSIDLHAVSGPGGGAGATQAKPGEEKVFTFKALNPGVYVYHCASPHIPPTSPRGCTASSWWSRPGACSRWTGSSTSCRAGSTPPGTGAPPAT